MSKIFFALADELTMSIEKNTEYLCKWVHQEQYDRVVLVGDKKTLEYIKIIREHYYQVYHSDIKLNVLIINNLENLDYIFERFKYKIREFPNSEIIINYTNGSSKLTAVAFIIARMYGLKMQEKLSIEDISEIKEFKVVEKENTEGSAMYFVKKLFNNYDYHMALEIIQENYSSRDKVGNHFIKLINIYQKWDSFEYEKYDFDDVINYFSNIDILNDNKEAIDILIDKNNESHNAYRIADLINNAERRIQEGRYEDAIIRFYRTLEILAEARLYEKYAIRKTDVHIQDLKNLDIEKSALDKIIKRLNFKYPKYTMHLTSAFFLLQKLFDEVGTYYYHNKDKYQQLFQKRNMSILVHGNIKYDSDEIMEMNELVISMARVYDKNIDNYIQKTKFPIFNV